MFIQWSVVSGPWDEDKQTNWAADCPAGSQNHAKGSKHGANQDFQKKRKISIIKIKYFIMSYFAYYLQMHYPQGISFTSRLQQIQQRNMHLGSRHDARSPLGITAKLSTLLAVVVSFQEKIEILRVKLCGHGSFSPELFYKQIDRVDKGYIDTEDFVCFIKRTKPVFNIDHRYLRSLFARMNQDERVPADRLTYFGYLNMIKPYFDTRAAKDLLLRDSIVMGNEVNAIAKKLLEQLLCTIYVCVAEHERVKQLIIFGDVEEGGCDPGCLYNIYELLEIVNQKGVSLEQNEQPQQNLGSLANSQAADSSFKSSHRRGQSSLGILDRMFNFIMKCSEYQLDRADMKYLLAYLMCHEYMVTLEKYLTELFMPVTSRAHTNAIQDQQERRFMTNKQLPKRHVSEPVAQTTAELNFLGYVHPQTLNHSEVYRNYQRAQQQPKSIRPQNSVLVSRSKLVNSGYVSQIKQPEIHIREPVRELAQTTIHTPILEKFMRESKVLKNMSRVRPDPVSQSLEQSSAFVEASRYYEPPRLPSKLAPPLERDYGAQQIMSNSNLQRSEYYQNLSQRANISKDPLTYQEISSPNKLVDHRDGGILNDFLLR